MLVPLAAGQVASPRASAAVERAWFVGAVYIDSAGASAGTAIEAVIGNTVCGQAVTAPGASHGPRGKAAASTFYIEVLGESERRGCGKDGDTIRFRSGGRFANEVAVWKAMPPRAPTMFSGSAAASYPPPLNLVFGPPVTVLSGLIRGQNPPPRSTIEAFVKGRSCGQGEVLPEEPAGDAWYVIIVRSDQATRGCAKAGDRIELRINGQPVPESPDGAPGTRSLDITFTTPHPAPDASPLAEQSDGNWQLWAGAAAGLALAIAVGALLTLRRWWHGRRW
ncbi:MAG TPA: hypothetical protein VNN10_14380 [Dehalococcoidia bacterium]|nr:hypothetical protein [Dehalococcoidia bacterium]